MLSKPKISKSLKFEQLMKNFLTGIVAIFAHNGSCL